MNVSDRRRVFGEKFVELGNYTVVGLIFSQIIIEEKNFFVIISGIVLTVIFWLIGFVLLKKERRKK